MSRMFAANKRPAQVPRAFGLVAHQLSKADLMEVAYWMLILAVGEEDVGLACDRLVEEVNILRDNRGQKHFKPRQPKGNGLATGVIGSTEQPL